MRKAHEDVKSGQGFVVLHGLPTEDGVTVDEFSAAVWGIGHWFGEALSRNTKGERIGHVVDASAEDATPRMYPCIAATSSCARTTTSPR